MNELKRHNFDAAKNRLKEFSEKTEAELAIDRVRIDGGFLGLGDHKVTGYELNSRLESIQGHLIDVNTTNNMTIKEFKEVYNALDSLDKEYITSIVANVKAIEKTSNDVRKQQEILKQHNDKLTIQQNKLDFHQVDMDKQIDNVKKVVTTLKAFKEQLDGYKHLTDVDKIWSNCKTIRNDIQVVSDSITALSQNQNETKEYAEANRRSIEELRKFRSEVGSIEHIADVDSIWEQGNDVKTNLAEANNHIVSLQEKTTKIDKVIADKTAEMQDKVVSLETKLKYAYYIAGGAFGLAVVELIFALTGVI